MLELDNKHKLLAALPKLPKAEQRLVVATRLLAVMLDGEITRKELRTFRQIDQVTHGDR